MIRFSGIQKYKNNFILFSEPFSINGKNVREVLRIELFDLQCCSVLKRKFETARVTDNLNLDTVIHI